MSDPANPYAASGLPEIHEPSARKVIVTASHGRRFANMVVDQIGLFLVQMVFSVAFFVIVGEEQAHLLEGLSGLVITIAIFLAYYIFFEGTSSRTPGKFLTGTIVVNEQGGRPSFGQILRRSFARLIPFEAFTFLKSPPRGLHDSVAKTYVALNR